jgi:hypothetical protein
MFGQRTLLSGRLAERQPYEEVGSQPRPSIMAPRKAVIETQIVE